MSDKDLQTTNNLTIDYGHFLIQDTSHLTTPSNPDLTETTIVNHAKNNYIQFTKGLFEMLKSQQGQDDESRDYDFYILEENTWIILDADGKIRVWDKDFLDCGETFFGNPDNVNIVCEKIGENTYKEVAV